MLRRKRVNGSERGAQLLELVLVFPLLIVLIAGAVAFGQAWNRRQILATAARSGARLGATQSTLDLTETNPPTIQKVCQQVASYLASENVSLAFMGMTSSTISSGCASPQVVAGSTADAWTYYGTAGGTTGTYGLTIEPMVQVPPPSFTSADCSATVNCIMSTRVTLSYPYNWTFGFNKVVQMIGASNYPSTITIQVYSTMANLSN